jgi:hypothetical protein|tara:strand:+ start:1105 stop:1284 length:180 start_codon:yes stop_codon:yes gene_type:complete
MSKCLKTSFYEVECKFEEEFDDVEKAHYANKPSDLATVEVLEFKLNKSKIKLIKEDTNG